MTCNDILTGIYNSPEIGEVMLKIRPEYLRDDLKQHVFLMVLEKENTEPGFIVKWHEVGKLRNYFAKILFQIINFPKDNFHRQFRRSTEILTDQFPTLADSDPELDLCLPCTEELQKVYWYNKELVEMYVEHGNYRAVSDATKIPLKSVYNAVQEGIKVVKYEVTKKHL